MKGGTEGVTPIAETAGPWEGIFRSALDRLAASPAFGRLRPLIRAEASHVVFRIPASPLSGFPTEDRLPEALASFISQFLIPLEAEAVDMIPEEIRVGPNVLSPVSTIQGLLLPSVVRGRDSTGTHQEQRAALLIPGFVALPTHVSRVGAAREVLVYVAPSAVTCALYDAPSDALFLDVVR